MIAIAKPSQQKKHNTIMYLPYIFNYLLSEHNNILYRSNVLIDMNSQFINMLYVIAAVRYMQKNAYQ